MNNNPDNADNTVKEHPLHPGYTSYEFKKNIGLCLANNITDTLGATAGYNLVMVMLLVHLHTSKLWIGLIQGGAWAAILGSYFSPYLSKRFRTKKYLTTFLGLPNWGPVVFIGLMIMYPQKFGFNDNQLRFAIIAVWYANWFTSGIINLICQEMRAGCIPQSFMGRYNGLAHSLGSAFSIGGTALAAYALKALPEPFDMGLLFMLGGVVSWIPWFFFPFLSEKPVENPDPVVPWTREMFSLCYNNKPFFRLLLINIISALTLGAVGSFVSVYALEDLKMRNEELAYLATIAQIEGVIMAIITGWIIDKYGPKKLLILASIIAFFSSMVIVAIPNRWGVYLSQVVGGVAGGISGPAIFGLYYILPKAEERRDLFTLQWTAIYFNLAVSPILGGLIFTKIPFMLGLKSAVLVSAAFIPFWMWVASVMPKGRIIKPT